MERVRPLPTASIFGLIVTAACGCGSQDSSQYRTYTPPADAAAAADSDSQTNLAPSLADSQSPVSTSAATPQDAALADNAAPDVVADPEVVPAAATAQTPVDTPAAPPQAAANASASADGELLASAGTADIAVVPAQPRETKLLIPEKSFRTEGGAQRVSYDDIDLLKVLNMEPVTPDAPAHFPAWLKDLDGQRILIRGYMRPGELSEDLPFFVLARDTQACCFGPNTKPYDIIPVIMRDGVTTDYIHLRPFDLAGVFHINVEMDLDDPNKVEFLYFIDDAVLIEK